VDLYNERAQVRGLRSSTPDGAMSWSLRWMQYSHCRMLPSAQNNKAIAIAGSASDGASPEFANPDILVWHKSDIITWR